MKAAELNKLRHLRPSTYTRDFPIKTLVYDKRGGNGKIKAYLEKPWDYRKKD